MTTREYAEAILVWRDPDIADVEDIIKAAVEEDRRAKPHEFVGRTDRGCELCGAPDRDTIHCYSRETSRRFVERAVEEERKALILALSVRIDDYRERMKHSGKEDYYMSVMAMEWAIKAIRARSNPAE